MEDLLIVKVVRVPQLKDDIPMVKKKSRKQSII